jgi:hypothetical protein
VPIQQPTDKQEILEVKNINPEENSALKEKLSPVVSDISV